ncbi:hypothetical protein [Haloferula rosea]|uniref:Uncharacterized protein n=1 Tax=Haloferula rosea TaxID=490093 RepID=A0A934RCR7_9BACT|nr:hypothetical protein [Haloferula rosea]MBK1827202.1 hypothetical protein [Haloferula rosea]
MKTSLFFGLLSLLMCTSSCDKRAPVAGGSSLAVIPNGVKEDQINLWYRTSRALRIKIAEEGVEVDPEVVEMINFSIIENYFPLFLYQRDYEKINQTHLDMAKYAYASLPPERRNQIFHIKDDDSFDALVETEVLSSFGFRGKEIKTLADFNIARTEYFNALNNLPGKQ